MAPTVPLIKAPTAMPTGPLTDPASAPPSAVSIVRGEAAERAERGAELHSPGFLLRSLLVLHAATAFLLGCCAEGTHRVLLHTLAQRD